MKIRAYGKTSRIPMALSNYILTGKGCKHDAQTFKDTIESAPFNAKSIAAALNRQKDILMRFTPVKQTETTIILEASDLLGNKDEIKITKI